MSSLRPGVSKTGLKGELRLDTPGGMVLGKQSMWATLRGLDCMIYESIWDWV